MYLRRIHGQYIVSIWYTCYRDMLSFTSFYTASIIRPRKGCDWEEELAVLCLHSYSTKKNTASGYFDFISRWNDHLIKISTKQNAYKRTKTRTRLERKWHITYAILKVLKKTDTFCRGLWLRYRRHSRVTRATSATKSKNVRLTQRSLNQIMRIVNFRRILLKKKSWAVWPGVCFIKSSIISFYLNCQLVAGVVNLVVLPSSLWNEVSTVISHCRSVPLKEQWRGTPYTAPNALHLSKIDGLCGIGSYAGVLNVQKVWNVTTRTKTLFVNVVLQHSLVLSACMLLPKRAALLLTTSFRSKQASSKNVSVYRYIKKEQKHLKFIRLQQPSFDSNAELFYSSG